MEKQTPHHPLAEVKAAVARAGVHALTQSAVDGAARMGLTVSEALDVVAGLTRRNFYKSMTTYADHAVWQDVYHAVCPNGRTAYIKFTLVAARPVIQFKEK